MHPGSRGQAGLSSDTVLKGTAGSTQFSGKEEMASLAGPALRSPGEGSSHRLQGAIFPPLVPQTLWAGLVRVCPAPGWASDPPLLQQSRQALLPSAPFPGA